MALYSMKLEPHMRSKARDGKPKVSHPKIKKIRHRLRRRTLKNGNDWNEKYYDNWEY